MRKSRTDLTTLICPYCGQQMIEGNIYGDRYALKFLPKGKRLLGGLWAVGGQIVGLGMLRAGGRPAAACRKCEACGIFIIGPQ